MTILERLKKDTEIQELRLSLYEITGEQLPFNYDCYLSIEEYREHLKACVKAKKIVSREKDKKAEERFSK